MYYYILLFKKQSIYTSKEQHGLYKVFFYLMTIRFKLLLIVDFLLVTLFVTNILSRQTHTSL
jgi:hypothetical protein